jgi:hypothetical protein
MSFAKTAALVLAAVALIACSKTSATAGDGGSAAATPSASATAGMASAASTGPEEAPPSERHADRKATKEITASNYKVELKQLAKELGP